MMASSSSSFEELSQESQDPLTDLNDEVHLKILEQPCKYFRFRYASEMVGSHGFITGNSYKGTSSDKPKTYPTVELCNYSSEAVVQCSLAQWDNDSVHVLRLSKESNLIVEIGPDVGYTVAFQNLGIIQPRKVEVNEWLLKCVDNAKDLTAKQLKELYSKIELNKARLQFTAYNYRTHKPLCPPVYSTVINSQKHASTKNLKICRMSRASGSCLGGDEIFLLVDKVTNNIGVRIYQTNAYHDIVWSAECIFNEKDDVHFQVAIVVKTPPYQNINIKKEVNVYIELYRKNEEMERSNAVPFTYTPEIRFDCYRTIENNVLHPLDPPCEPMAENEYENRNIMNLGPLLPNNELAFADDYRKPLQVQSDLCDESNYFDREELRKFAENFANAKDYPGFEDLEGDKIMDMDFGHNFMSDGIVEYLKSNKPSKTKFTKNTAKLIGKGKYKTRMYVDPASDYEYSEEDDIPINVFLMTAKVENTTDIDIEESGLKSYENSEEEKESNIDLKAALERFKISNTQGQPQNSKKDADDRQTTGARNNNSEVGEIDARLLDAIEQDSEALLEDLLDQGFSPTVCDKNGNNALHCAVKSKTCLPVLLKLCKGKLSEVINAWNNDNKTPLHLAASENSPKKVRLLLSHSARHDLLDDDGRSPLHVAAAEGHLEVVETLLDCVTDMDVDNMDGKGQTALQIVCAGEDNPDNRAIVELLLEKGANAVTAAGSLSAIQLAKDKPKIMKILQTYVYS